MAATIACNACGATESVTTDTPEPLQGWTLTKSMSGTIVQRHCPTCAANRRQPSAGGDLSFTLDDDCLI